MHATATKSSTRKLSEVARHVVMPSGIVSTGWRDVEDQCREFGDEFDEWQRGAGSLILGKDTEGIYTATVGGVTISIPRQVAKTFLVGRIVFALCVLFPGLKVLWTAHRTRTSTNTFKSLQGYARRKSVAPHVESIRTANGEQEIAFVNGSVIMFGAREAGFGRGFDEVDVEVFDEAQILTEKALEDMVAATNQSRHPHGALLFFMGTPPRPIDPGEAFTGKRDDALSGKPADKVMHVGSDAVYIECSADADADPDDREQWKKANPSFPDRTPLRSMLRLRKNLPSDESWLREALGIWQSVRTGGVLPMDAWGDRADEFSKVGHGPPPLGLEIGPDLAWASISLAGRRADGEWHVELVEARNGAAWVPAYLDAVLDKNPGIPGVVVDVGGPIKSMITQRGTRYTLDGPDIRLTPLRVSELTDACTKVLVGTVTGWLHHIDQPQLTAAAQSAGKRMIGDTGTWVFSRKSTTSDITPIQSATYALWGAQNESKLKTPRPPRGSAGGREYVTRNRAGRGAT